MKQLLTTREAAYLADCSPDDLGTAARSGKIVATRKGKFWRFHLKSVLAWKRRVQK